MPSVYGERGRNLTVYVHDAGDVLILPGAQGHSAGALTVSLLRAGHLHVSAAGRDALASPAAETVLCAWPANFTRHADADAARCCCCCVLGGAAPLAKTVDLKLMDLAEMDALSKYADDYESVRWKYPKSATEIGGERAFEELRILPDWSAGDFIPLVHVIIRRCDSVVVF